MDSGGTRRVLEGLHPRRLPGGPVRGVVAHLAVPVPPVGLRRARLGPTGDGSGGLAAAPAAADHRRGRLRRVHRRLLGTRRPGLVEAVITTVASAWPLDAAGSETHRLTPVWWLLIG